MLSKARRWMAGLGDELLGRDPDESGSFAPPEVGQPRGKCPRCRRAWMSKGMIVVSLPCLLAFWLTLANGMPADQLYGSSQSPLGRVLSITLGIGVWMAFFILESSFCLRAKHVPLVAVITFFLCDATPCLWREWAADLESRTFAAPCGHGPALYAANVVTVVLLLLAYIKWIARNTWIWRCRCGLSGVST